ncbi:MAG: GNAT family N-acetyltransferase [Clostridia bacterium]|nr:GNAT family N-acetyltransferase [Clostridia bacterium]
MKQILFFMDSNPVLNGDRIVMRKITKTDAQDMYDYACDPEVTRYLLWQPHESLSYTKRYLDEVMRQYKAHNFFDFAIVCKEDGRMIGTCGFTRLDPVNHSAEIGYVLSPAYWGRGIASEAVEIILRFAFCNLGVHRVEARYMPGNAASRRVMEKKGMVFEGVERDAIYVKGAYQDVGKCAILRSEYLASHENRPFFWKETAPRSPFAFFS